MSFARFLNDLDPTLSKEYKLECFRENTYQTPLNTQPTTIYQEPEKKPEIVADPYFIGLIQLKTLATSHPVMRKLSRRMIPENKLRQLWLAPKFYAWAKKIDDVFGNFKNDHPRLIIPYYDQDKKLLGFSCRAFGDEQPKYVQLRLNKDADFIYGLDKVDTSKPFYVLEGQIDSMFIPNSIAVGNANYSNDFVQRHKDNAVIIPDNDFRRNPDVCKQLKKAISGNMSVCLFPDHWPKDVNDAVKSGIPVDEILKYIQTNTKKGLEAMLEFTLEKRC
jgi:hypothetical protein